MLHTTHKLTSVTRGAITCMLTAAMVAQPMQYAFAAPDGDTASAEAPTTAQDVTAALIMQGLDTGTFKTQEDKDIAVAAQSEIVDEAKATNDEKQAAADTAKDSLDKAEAAVTAKEQERDGYKTEAFKLMDDYLASLETQKSELTKKIAELTTEKDTLTQSNDQLAKDIKALQDKLETLSDGIDPQTDTVESATNSADEAKSALDAKKKEWTDAENALIAASNTLKEKTAAALDANASLSTAKAELEQLKSTLQEKQAARDAAQTELDNAQAAYDRAKQDGEPVVDQDRVDELQKKVDAASSEVNDLNAQISQKADEIAKTESSIESLNADISEAEQAKSDLEATLADARKAVENNAAEQQAADKYIADLEAKATEKTQLESQKTDLQQQIDQLTQQKTANDSHITEIDAKIDELNKQKSGSSSTNSEMAEKIARWKTEGIAGFYEWIGATEALKILKGEGRYDLTDTKSGEKFASFTNLGNEKDATSLTNVEAAVKLIQTGNQVRAIDSLSALKISLNLMALAEVNANWSAANGYIAHASSSGQATGNGENAAWGMEANRGGTSFDELSRTPYDGWYTEEKKNYDKWQASGKTTYDSNVDGQTGHYTNLMEKNKPLSTSTPMHFVTTGFGRSRYGYVFSGYNFDVTDVQDFNTATPSSTYPGGTVGVTDDQVYTIDEFSAKLAEYKQLLASDSSDTSDIDQQIATLQKEKDGLTSSNATIESDKSTKQQELSGVQSKLDDLAQVEKDLQAAKEKKATLENDARDLAANVESIQQKIDAKASEISNKNSELSSLSIQKSTLEGEKSSLENTRTQKQADLDALQEELTTAKNGSYQPYVDAISAAEKKVSAADTALKDAQSAISEKESAIENLQSAADVAAKEQVSAQALKDEKNEAVAQIDRELTPLKEANQRASEKKDKVVAYFGTKDELSAKEQQKASVEQQLQTNQVNLDAAEAALEEANNNAFNKDEAWDAGFVKAAAPAARMRVRRAASALPRQTRDAAMMDTVNELREKYNVAAAELDDLKVARDEAETAYGTASDEYKLANDTYNSRLAELDLLRAALVEASATTETESEGSMHVATQESKKEEQSKPDAPKHMKKAASELPQTGDPAFALMGLGSLVAGLSALGASAKARRRK